MTTQILGSATPECTCDHCTSVSGELLLPPNGIPVAHVKMDGQLYQIEPAALGALADISEQLFLMWVAYAEREALEQLQNLSPEEILSALDAETLFNDILRKFSST